MRPGGDAYKPAMDIPTRLELLNEGEIPAGIDDPATWAARLGSTGTGRTSSRQADMACALVKTGRATCPSERLTARVAASWQASAV